MAEWTDQQIRDHWVAEVRARFERDNAAWRAEEEVCSASLDDESRDRLFPGGVSDSSLWQFYLDSEICVERNVASVLLPSFTDPGGGSMWSSSSYFLDDAIMMFGDTMMSWSGICVRAVVVGGVPRVELTVYLVDSWDDDRAAAWSAERTASVVSSPQSTP